MNMFARSILIGAAALMVAGPFMEGAALAALSPPPDRETERKIVVFKPDTKQAEKRQAIKEADGKLIETLPSANAVVAKVPREEKKELLAEDEVLRVDPDNLNRIIEAPSGAAPGSPGNMGPASVAASSQVTPYGAGKIVRRNPRLKSAWTRSSGRYAKVAVIDTGIDRDHPDLAGNIAGGVNTSGGSRYDYEDRMGHGTHVAGIIAGRNNRIGTVGVAPSAKIYAVRVFSGYYAYDSDIIAGIDWAIARRVHVINMSLGTAPGASPNPSFQRAIYRARSAGILVFAASGNSGAYLNRAGPVYPAAYNHVLAVSATGSTDRLAWFSNYGSIVDFAAPGISNRSTYLRGGYASLSGTSMATPHAAGAAALRVSQKIGLRSRVSGSYFRDKIVSDMAFTTYDAGRRGRDVLYGFGVPNGQRLVARP